MKLTVEGVAQYLPHYLSAERREGIVKALGEFPAIKFFYLNAYQDEQLQGDCWAGLTVINFRNGERKKIRGVLLSNSCDMDENNPSMSEKHIVFVPLIRLENLAKMWRAALPGHTQKIESTLRAIRGQEISEYMYFPAGANIDAESVALLDQVHTIPRQSFKEESEKRKLATLSDPSFYLFILKLSIHFCRLHENVDRSEAAQATT